MENAHFFPVKAGPCRPAPNRDPWGHALMHVISDLMALFAAIAVTYLGARLWQHILPRLPVWCAFLGHQQGRQGADADPRPAVVAPASEPTPVAETREPDADSACGNGTFQILFEINGMTVDPSKLQHIVGKTLLKTIHRSVKRRAGQVRCPQHGSAPKIVVTGKSLGNLSWQAPGCCATMQALLKQTLRNGL
jgi:hypothetical protein